MGPLASLQVLHDERQVHPWRLQDRDHGPDRLGAYEIELCAPGTTVDSFVRSSKSAFCAQVSSSHVAGSAQILDWRSRPHAMPTSGNQWTVQPGTVSQASGDASYSHAPKVREPNVAEFTMDTSDPKQPNSPFRLFVVVPQP